MNAKEHIFRFSGCRHLDYTAGKYTECYRNAINARAGETRLCWNRAIQRDLVNFCTKRGRLNYAVCCSCDADKVCGDFEPNEHVVSVHADELEAP